MGRRAAILIFAVLLAACATRPPPVAMRPALDLQLAELRERLFILVEEERLRLNPQAKPLYLDPQLSGAAQAHAEDMAKKMSFDTMNPDGNVAVNVLLTDPKFGGFVGENSAEQYFTPSFGIDPDAYAKGFLTIWLNSAQHKSNLTYGGFERTGIGIAANGNAIYAAEVFSADIAPPQEPPQPASDSASQSR